MKKIFLIIWIIYLIQISITNANNYNDLYNSCSSKDITQKYNFKYVESNIDIKNDIDSFIKKNNLGEIVFNSTHKIGNGEYKTKELMIGEKGDYIFLSSKMNREDNIIQYYIVKNGNILKSFNDTYIFTELKENFYEEVNSSFFESFKPSIFLSKDSKHYGYSYKKDNEYCVNLDGNETCYKSGGNNIFNFYPTNISFNDKGDKFIYSIFTGEQGDDGIFYSDIIYINNKKVTRGGGYYKYSDGLGRINDLFFSPDSSGYAYTIINSDKDKDSRDFISIYKNGKIITGNFSYGFYSLYFSPDSKDLYSNGYITGTNDFKMFKNNIEISYFKLFGLSSLFPKDFNINLDSIKGFSIDDRMIGFNEFESYITYKGKLYNSNYNLIFNLSIDGGNLSFIGIDFKNNKIYENKCILNEEIYKYSKLNNNLELTIKEINIIDSLGQKINNMTYVKKSKYINILYKYINMFDKGSKKYLIIDRLLNIITMDKDY